jgi:hypothetical protein
VAGPPSSAAARNVELMTTKEIQDHLPHIIAVDKFFEGIKRVVTAGLLDQVDLVARNLGNIAYIVGAALAILNVAILASKAENDAMLTAALLAVPAAVVLHYSAVQFLTSAKLLIAQTPSRLSSNAFLRVFALVQAALAGLFVSSGYYSFIELTSIPATFWGLMLAISAAYTAALALNPDAVNVEISSTASAGEEAIGILAFLAKAHLRMVSALFGIGSIFGVLAMLYVLYELLAEGSYAVMLMTVPAAVGVLFLALLPFFAYLAFLFAYLLIDVLRSLLSIPRAVAGAPDSDREAGGAASP